MILQCNAVFEVFFDPIKGSTLEWYRSANTTYLKDIELLVLGPGFQNTETDYIVFQVPSNPLICGAAAFDLLKTTAPEERYARMRSVGVLGSSMSSLRRLIPILSIVAKEINRVPNNFTLVEELADVLMDVQCTQQTVSEFVTRIQNNFIGIIDMPSVQLWGPIAESPLVINHPVFLLLWRAVLCRRRIILFSKYGAGKLCDVCLDLEQCTTMSYENNIKRKIQFLMYRTSYQENDILSFTSKNEAYVMATTDPSVLIGPVPWDIVIFMHNRCDEEGNTVDSLLRHISKKDKTSSYLDDSEQQSITVYFSENCDIRVYNSINSSKEEVFWKWILQNQNENISMESNIDLTKGFLTRWCNSFMTEVLQHYLDSTLEPTSTNSSVSYISRRTLLRICKAHKVEKSQLPLFVLMCEAIGISVLRGKMFFRPHPPCLPIFCLGNKVTHHDGLPSIGCVDVSSVN